MEGAFSVVVKFAKKQIRVNQGVDVLKKCPTQITFYKKRPPQNFTKRTLPVVSIDDLFE